MSRDAEGAGGAAMRHQEAFAIMAYRCEMCGVQELLWNSRDGVTPFCVNCASCGVGTMNHVNFGRDVFAPDHRPLAGQRYFRDGLPSEARSIARRRLESARGTDYEVPVEEWPGMIERIITPTMVPLTNGEMVPIGEFAPGWPMLVTAGTDADTLPPLTTARAASPRPARPEQ